ncbi:MAG: hypothetical protein PHR81_08420, partial [Bacteroidales bacterium]|nr:hypothetical protein [Bacteroidales bacterium]
MKNIYNKIFLILKLLVVLFILLNTTDTFAQKSIDDNDLAYEWTDSPDKIPSSFIVDEINKSLAISNEHIPISWNAMAGTSMTVTPNVTTICAGGTVNITWNWNLGDGHPGTAEYSTDNVNWYLMNAGTLATISNGVAKSITPAGTTTYYGRVRSTTNPVGDLYSNSCTITVVADPTVGTQPTSPVSICTGGTSGNMTAAGSGGTGTFSYQWQYNNGGTWGSVSNGSPAGSIYTGGTSGTMSVAGISSANNYQYHCIISQTGSGCGQLTTNTVTVSVAADPTAPSLNVATPASGSTVCVGGKVSATFNAGS